MIEIIVKTEIKPTEDEEKVKKAIENLFEYETISKVEEGGLKYYLAKANSLKALNRIKESIKKQRIENSARSVIERSLKGNELSFKLNKQAAYMKRVSFVTVEGESSLGAIEVNIKGEDLQKILDYIAPKIEQKKTKAEFFEDLEQQ